MANNYMSCSFELLMGSAAEAADVLRFADELQQLEEYYYDEESTVPQEIEDTYGKPIGENEVDELYVSGHIQPMPGRRGVDHTDRRIWFWCDEGFNPNYFNLVIKYAMKTYKIERFGYSWAYTCSKPRLGNFGGEGVVLTDYGENIEFLCTDDWVTAMENQTDALHREDSTDYKLNSNHQSVWVTVHDLSVYIRRNDDGVSVDIYDLNKEMDESLAGTWALYRELPEETDGKDKQT